MMKKMIATALLSTAAISSSQATVFNGFAAGVNAGILKADHVSKTFGTFGVQFDYEMSKMNSFYFGTGLNFSFHTGKVGNHNIHVKYDYTSDLDARFGYNICNQTVVYALAGGRVQKASAHAHLNNVHHHASKTVLLGFVGGGAKTKLSSNVSAGVEYKYGFERKKKFAPATNMVLARVSYHF